MTVNAVISSQLHTIQGSLVPDIASPTNGRGSWHGGGANKGFLLVTCDRRRLAASEHQHPVVRPGEQEAMCCHSNASLLLWVVRMRLEGAERTCTLTRQFSNCVTHSNSDIDILCLLPHKHLQHWPASSLILPSYSSYLPMPSFPTSRLSSYSDIEAPRKIALPVVVTGAAASSKIKFPESKGVQLPHSLSAIAKATSFHEHSISADISTI